MHLIGVRHDSRYLRQAIGYLNTLPLEDKRIMLEIPDYPIPREWHEVNPDFVRFYDGIARHALGHGASLLYAESMEIFRKQRRIHEEIAATGDEARRVELSLDLIFDSWQERETHLARRIYDERPDYLVIGQFHLRTLRDIIPCTEIDLTSPGYAGRSTPSPSSQSRRRRASSGSRPRRASARGRPPR